MVFVLVLVIGSLALEQGEVLKYRPPIRRYISRQKTRVDIHSYNTYWAQGS